MQKEKSDFIKYEECETCKEKVCPETCFNSHPGSLIALRKLADASGKKVHIIGEYNEGS